MATPRGKNLVRKVDSEKNEWQWIGGTHRSRVLASEFRWDAVSAGQVRPGAYSLYRVRPSTPSELLAFRLQEAERYRHPEKAFIYRMHDYEAPVGPLRRFGPCRDSKPAKPRPHYALLSNRPACVSLLSLVRDAVSRLPNGQGTRDDIITLLKDSQYLNPNLTEEQCSTLVSCALDRLHAEADPCVKYDSQEKVWVNLHHNRTAEMMENELKFSEEANKLKTKFIKETKSETSVVTDYPPAKSKYNLRPSIQHRKSYESLCEEMHELFGEENDSGTNLEDISSEESLQENTLRL
ncbi:nuclear factor related to kappa-B-binding protein-like isoform X2 [Zophobas morio]|uniref:nuclear factor related to kappa-B-binding protein-like isoform X2 n=1 Tax=Zophobas morio TaxID=2755281 RepID=UPI0030837006